MSVITCQELKAICKSNTKLPDTAFFTYKGVEIIEFNLSSVELMDGRVVLCDQIEKTELSLAFD